MRDRIKALMARVFEIEADQIIDDATADDLEQWDSLNHLKLMLAIEEEFDVKPSAEQMLDLVSVEAIDAYVSAARKPDGDRPRVS